MRRRNHLRPNAIRLHQRHPSGQYDWRGVEICTCGSAFDASVHRLKERSEDERAEGARRVGERA